MNATTQEMLREKLGEVSFTRLENFKRGYPHSLHEAYDAFLEFVSNATFPKGKVPPSIFFDDDGDIELLWEDSNDVGWDVMFRSNHIVYGIGPNESVECPLSEAAEIAKLTHT